MPVPKTKSSRSRRDKRRANWKLTVPGLVECPQCHAMKKPHHVCPTAKIFFQFFPTILLFLHS